MTARPLGFAGGLPSAVYARVLGGSRGAAPREGGEREEEREKRGENREREREIEVIMRSGDWAGITVFSLLQDLASIELGHDF